MSREMLGECASVSSYILSCPSGDAGGQTRRQGRPCLSGTPAMAWRFRLLPEVTLRALVKASPVPEEIQREKGLLNKFKQDFWRKWNGA